MYNQNKLPIILLQVQNIQIINRQIHKVARINGFGINYQFPHLPAGEQKFGHPSDFLVSPDQFVLQMLPSVPTTVSIPHREGAEAIPLSGAVLVSLYAEPLTGSAQAKMLF